MRWLFLCSVVLLLAGCASRPVRFATFNASLNRDRAGQLIGDLSTPDNAQAKKVAEVIQRVRPDVLLINEFDFDADQRAATLFRSNYLLVAQGGAKAIDYPYFYVAPSNTGVHSSLDLNNDGRTVLEPGTRGYGEDSFGFGQFEGQYSFVVFSRYPIRYQQVRTLQLFRWSELPGSMMPTGFYSPRAVELMRLSSKNHVDVPIEIDGKVVHVLAAHPTPPVFDGPEDRNGLRNHDEIKLLAMMIDKLSAVASPPGAPSPVGDAGDMPRVRDERFVVMGDMNADPNDGDSVDRAIRQLLDHPRVDARCVPTSRGAVEAAQQQAGPNAEHRTDPASDTSDFDERRAKGNLRVDYVLPYRGAEVLGGGVYWPPSNEAGHALIDCSDHRLVWLDLRVR